MVRGMMLTVAAALVIVVVLALGATSPAMGQGATPEATTDLLAGIGGVEDAALRGFEPSGMRLVGTLYLVFVAVDFASADHASDALPLIVDRMLLTIPGDAPDMRPASARTLGDETIAFAGTSTLEGVEATIAVVGVRSGDLVRLGIGTALAGDPLGDVVTVLGATVDRAPGDQATPTTGDGMRAGGLWDALPRLEDMPEGFVFGEDRGLLAPEPSAWATPAR